jgi:hypothetical protein
MLYAAQRNGQYAANSSRTLTCTISNMTVSNHDNLFSLLLEARHIGLNADSRKKNELFRSLDMNLFLTYDG